MDASQRYCYNPVLKWNRQVEEYFVKAYGTDHFSRISKALTLPSCYSCIRVNTLHTTSDTVIKKLNKIIQDSGYEANLTEEHGNELISKCQVPGLDYVLFVKGSGPHEVDYCYAPGKPPREVIVSRKCAEAVLRGAQVYVPGIMACSAHVEKGDAVAVSVAVEQPGVEGGWSIGMTRGTVLQSLQTDPYCFERNGLYIGQGTTMMSRAGIFRTLQGIAVDMNKRVFRLPSFHSFGFTLTFWKCFLDVLEGDIFLQNLPSIVTAHALDPQRGEHILDMCAAPGGKTTAIAILMKDEGEIVAADRSHNKVMDIQKLAVEMGINCISTYKLDALKAVCRRNELNNTTTAHDDMTMQISGTVKSSEEEFASIDAERLKADATCKENGRAGIRKNTRIMKNGPGRNQCQGGRAQNSKGFEPKSFDRVLLDAPCSALGLRPRLFAGEETIESLRNHGKYQRRMFDQAVKLVRPGGVIVYSTCTINPGENEALVRYALDTYKFLSLAPQHPRIGGPGLVGRCEFPDGYNEEWLRPGEEEMVQRFDPSSQLDTIGFFIAKFTVGNRD